MLSGSQLSPSEYIFILGSQYEIVWFFELAALSISVWFAESKGHNRRALSASFMHMFTCFPTCLSATGALREQFQAKIWTLINKGIISTRDVGGRCTHRYYISDFSCPCFFFFLVPAYCLRAGLIKMLPHLPELYSVTTTSGAVNTFSYRLPYLIGGSYRKTCRHHSKKGKKQKNERV